MIVKLPLIINRDGTVRLQRKAQPGKDEILATVHLDIPDSAFAPPALVLRATVVPAVSGGGAAPVSTERPTPNVTVRQLPETAPKLRVAVHKPLVRDSGKPWTPERIRALMARLELDRDALAMTLGVPVATVKRWEESGDPEAIFRDELATLEADAMAVSR